MSEDDTAAIERISPNTINETARPIPTPSRPAFGGGGISYRSVGHTFSTWLTC
jgi:hypothetical protein